MHVASGVLLVAGSCFLLLAGVGVLRFPDVYSRMHAASKGPTLGLLLIAVGAAIELHSAAAVTLTLVVVLQFLTAPVGAHLVGRAVHRRMPVHLDDVDELARALDAGPADEPGEERGDASGDPSAGRGRGPS